MSDVLVVGGGLAGITAALDCAEAGASVTLVEVRRRLGGAAYSFERDGLQMDNGQHVFLRCCGSYRALLERLSSSRLVSVQPRLSIPVLSPGRAPARLARGGLPAPLHLAGALARYPYLSSRRRLGAARAALALMRLDPADPALEELTFGDWLARHGQDAEAVDALWDLIALPTLNLRAAEASLGLAAFVFRTGLLSGADAGDIGFHVATLQAIIGDPARAALERAGVEIRLGWRAERLARTPEGFELHGRGAGGEESLGGAALVLALPHDRAGGLLEPLLGPNAGRPAPLASSPIVNLHIVYDRPVMDEPFAAGVGTPVQYLFDRTEASGAPAGTQYLAVSLSGADREMALSVEQLRERYLPALQALLPRARTAHVESFLATREHAATFRAVPGSAALRPPSRTAVPGLALAGTWTATGWPATLESAVFSGHAAARVALNESASGRPGPAGRAPEPAQGMRSSELLVAAPLRLEAVLIGSAARGGLVRKTGMGPRRARLAAQELGLQAARAMLVLGFCGGLDESSVPGEVIVAEEVVAAPGEGHPEEPVTCELAVPLLGRLTGLGMKVRTGKLVCVSRLALGERREELRAGARSRSTWSRCGWRPAQPGGRSGSSVWSWTAPPTSCCAPRPSAGPAGGPDAAPCRGRPS